MITIEVSLNEEKLYELLRDFMRRSKPVKVLQLKFLAATVTLTQLLDVISFDMFSTLHLTVQQLNLNLHLT